MRERGLWDRTKAERLGRQHEIADIGATVDRTINTERLVGVDDGDVRRAEEIEILQRLFRVGRFVAFGNAEGVVELKAAFPPPLQIHAAIFPRKRKIAVIDTETRRRVDGFPKLFLR